MSAQFPQHALIAQDDQRGLRDPQPLVQSGGLPGLLSGLRQRDADRVVADWQRPASAGRYEPLPEALHPELLAALRSRGITRLYSHQAEAWQVVQSGQNVLLATPTASGKSLCYHLPVIDRALRSDARALYLFPTKALSQDQVADVLEWNRHGALGVRIHTFDGDTPSDARQQVRKSAQIVVTNPDMLHQGILPHHPKWAALFENLRYIVIDELHVYRGVFGSHVANVMRRLQRIAAHYGARPQFIAASATIGNPAEHAERLLGVPVHAIESSGAPQGPLQVLIWNPPVVNPDLGIRASSRSQCAHIAKQAVRRGLKTIVFANSRLQVELLTRYLKDAFDADPRRRARVRAYRGGYLPLQRRAVEQQLRRAEIDCVVSTSALELGVDIGALDVCLVNGFPGSIASLWQRFGRAGRREQPALAVMVAGSDPLDQYLARNPQALLGVPVEQARIDPDQLLIQFDHLRCAAFELPFRAAEHFGAADPAPMLDLLAEQGVLDRDGDRWHWIADSYPAQAVSLRSVADGNFLVVDITDGGKSILAEVDFSSAALTLYEGAIYLLQSAPWQVERLDWTGRKAYVRRVEADYYTDAIDHTRLKILDRFELAGSGVGECGYGEVHVVRHVAGYKKIRLYTHENIGYGPVNLPDQELHTTAVWWSLPEALLARAFADRSAVIEGFLGAAYALHVVARVFAMAEGQDLCRAVGDGEAAWAARVGESHRGALQQAGGSMSPAATAAEIFVPTLYLYDNFPGGVGMSATLFAHRHQLLQSAAALIAGCACRTGCPSCVGPVPVVDERRDSPRQLAAQVLALLSEP